MAEGRKPSEKIRLGAADVERILQSYWRTSQVKAEIERYKTSEKFKQKQEEIARLERELSTRRFAFFRGRRADQDIREKRDELRKLSEKEAQRVREREKEAIEELMTDIRRSAESIGRESAHTMIFDSNTPHIIFMTTDFDRIDDITDAVIDDLNSQ